MEAQGLSICYTASGPSEPPWDFEKQVFEIIVEYLDPEKEMSPRSAAIRIDSLTPWNQERLKVALVYKNADMLLVEAWGFFIGIAKQIPYNHPAQGQLVDLVVELANMPYVKDEAGKVSIDYLSYNPLSQLFYPHGCVVGSIPF